MTYVAPAPMTASPFHAGEQTMQARAGKREAMESIGHKIIRSFMPDQHREFFAQLPFVVLGSVDAHGWPWASIVSGAPGFLTSPDARRLDVAAMPLEGDPLAQGLNMGASIGALGIEIPTRRRNRMNARVVAADQTGFSLGVDQSFGNCPQYIQTRRIKFIRDPVAPRLGPAPEKFLGLDVAARGFIRAADTFFVASYVQAAGNPVIEGVDVSHRGGRAGFVKVEGDTLTIPDYSGNFHFNTLGNFLVNPKAGLIFPDFETGDVLMLTGTVELIPEDDPRITAFRGADRGWQFTLDHGIRLRDALPFRAEFGEWSPNSLMASDWIETDARIAAQKGRNTWRPFRVMRIEDESSVIRSFYLEPDDAGPALPFKAGQFLTLRIRPDGAERPLVRTYTVSSPPLVGGYRISVKREPGGVVSNHMHDALGVGDIIEIKAPKGGFHIDAAQKRPAVLLAGGVGITPMVAMAQHVLNEGRRTRFIRPLTIFHAAQTTAQRAFGAALQALERESDGRIKYYSIISQPAAGETVGPDFDGTGHITADVLRQVLPLDDYDFYLCGPAMFMQGLYDALRALGVRDARIYAEAFGPAVLKRAPDGNVAPLAPAEAETAVIRFVTSDFEQGWSRGDETLLETAEAHGLTPDFSCRNGVCGSCATRKLSGEVVYRTQPSADHSDDEVLICCAVPAFGTETVALDL